MFRPFSMDYANFYFDHLYGLCPDRVIWDLGEMGNACACLGGGGDSDYALAGRKRAQNGQVEGRSRSRSNTGEVASSSDNGGNYRKTAVAAKYTVPESNNQRTDVNKNQKPPKIIIEDDPELDLRLRSPSPEVTEAEVKTFFVSHDEGEKTPGNDTISQTGAPSRQNDTHVEVFSVPGAQEPPTGPPDPGGRLPSHNSSPQPGSSPKPKTHVEVFSLNLAREDDPLTAIDFPEEMAAAEPTPTESSHVNFMAFLGGGSPIRSPGHDNPVFTMDEEETVTVTEVHTGEDPPRVDGSSRYTVPDSPQPQTNDPNSQDPPLIPHIDVSSRYTIPDQQTNLDTPLIDATGAGEMTNVAFNMSDECEITSSEIYLKKSLTISDSEEEGEVSDVEEPDEKYFFFGMESLKFQDNQGSKGGLEADREISEIMANIFTIEESLLVTLRSPKEEAFDLEDTKTEENLYEDVLNGLAGVCQKVEHLLRKKGLGKSDEVDASWINMPEMVKINQHYDKRTIKAQAEAAKQLLKAAEKDDDEAVKTILEEYKKQQEKLLRLREAEKQKIKNRLKSKMAARQERSQGAHNESDQESDSEQVRTQYGEIMKAGSQDDDSDTEDSSYSQDSSEYSSTDSGEEHVYLDVENPEAAKELRSTLTQDIQSRMTNMTVDDFKSIMGLYRQEQRSMRDVRDSESGRYKQSLWEKLAERRKHVDQSIYEGPEDQKDTPDGSAVGSLSMDTATGPSLSIPTGDTETNTTYSDASMSTDTHPGMEEGISSILTADTATEVTLEDLDVLNKDMLNKATQMLSQGQALDKSDADRLLQEHFDNVRKLREQKERDAQLHRQKVLQKLKQKQQQGDISVDDVEEALTGLDERLEKENQSLETECLEKMRERDVVSQEDFETVLSDYRKAQAALQDQRTVHRAAIEAKLRNKLAIKAQNRSVEQGMEAHKDQEAESKKAENEIIAMDNAFYQSLLARRAAGELTADQLAQLIEEHLTKVEDFKQQVRKQMQQQRKQRRQMASKAEASALVEEDMRNREQARRVRREERSKMDSKLQEKLNKSKQKNVALDNPELPPRRPARKKKSSRKERSSSHNPTSYENVELDF